MYRWEPDKIRMMKDASEYGEYNKVLAECIVPYLKAENHICDCGCGLGYLSIELSKFVEKVTAVDIHEGALQVLEDNCIKKGIGNVKPVCSDMHALDKNEKFDKMVFCFYGDTEEILELGDRYCCGDLFIITRNYDYHRFSKGKEIPNDKRLNYKEICRALNQQGIMFEGKELDLEFGQPFRNADDARLFFRLYSKDNETAVFSDEELTEMLEQTGREDFPLYLRKKRKVGFIRIIKRG